MKNGIELSKFLSSPRKNKIEKNLDIINKESKDGEIIVVPGKVLSIGELDKKIKIVALNFSKSAKEKILKSGEKFQQYWKKLKKIQKQRRLKF